LIAPEFGQKKTSDDCYVFLLDNVASAHINMAFIDDTVLIPLESVPYPEVIVQLDDLIAQAEALKAGNAEFPLQISHTDGGSDVNKAFPWVYADELEGLDNALEFARNAPLLWADEAIASLDEAMGNFVGKIKADGSDPYFRLDPGPGKVPVELTAPTNVWTTRTPLDSRVPANFAGGTYEVIPYPFADSDGKADVLKINYAHNGTSTFGGITVQSPLSPAVNVPAGSTIEFDVYYPKSAQGKYMRWRIRNINSNLDSYMRDYEYNNLNPDWVGSYNGETWLRAHHSVSASVGVSSNFILELHGETSRPAETGTLLVSNIRITAPDPNGVALPNVVNSENQSVVAPLKSVYNREDGLFMVGAIGTGPVTGTRARQYEIFVDGNNLKAESTHPRGPSWLTSVTGAALSGATTTPGLGEYTFPTDAYQAIRDSGAPGEYQSHAHVLAWYNQAPAWMRQIIPANLPAGYSGTTDFYGLGNGVTTQVPVDKEMARRVQFNHTMYVMRHFLTTDPKYGSSVSRGVIPFNSWDVLNEEVHESRHSELIPLDADNWRTSLKHTNWLVAMSDDLIGGDVTDHYIYLLFKYAHIAAPNTRMATAYKANYAGLPEYMKLDGHDTDGSIDAYVVDNPPKLTYNDYGLATRSKARTVYNMVRELNTAWLSDPLYDGRPLIEDIGIQGHDSIGKTLASDNQYAMALYASLVDQGLLSGMSFSEFDLKLPTNAPGGGATAPAVLNVRQSDALGYEYALMYKLFTKFAPYIDHVISWGVAGEGWQGSYVLFDSQSNANAGYYGAMNPDRFILGHSYLDDYYSGEYQKLQDGYKIDLGDLGLYTR
jgi:GH35 family endo-1,4-beta-xylanase